MKKLKMLLAAALVFGASSTYAMDGVSEVQSQNELTVALTDKSDFDTEKFEDMMEQILTAEPTSILKRSDFFDCRELVKLVIIVAEFFLSINDNYRNNGSSAPLIAAAFLIPFISNKILRRGDKTLNSMKKLEEYISGLTHEQKAKVTEEFKTTYSELLANKVKQDTFGGASIIAATIDIGVIPFAFFALTCISAALDDGKIKPLDYESLACLFLVSSFAEFLSNAKAAYNHPSFEKNRSLARIQAALK